MACAYPCVASLAHPGNECPSVWPVRRARRYAASRKMEQMERLVQDLQDRVVHIQSCMVSRQAAGSHQPDAENSPERIYSRGQMLSYLGNDSQGQTGSVHEAPDVTPWAPFGFDACSADIPTSKLHEEKPRALVFDIYDVDTDDGEQALENLNGSLCNTIAHSMAESVFAVTAAIAKLDDSLQSIHLHEVHVAMVFPTPDVHELYDLNEPDSDFGTDNGDETMFVKEAFLSLEDVRARAVCRVEQLQEEASFFNRNHFDSHADALDSYWRLFVPEGMSEREAENAAIEEEELDLEVAFLGNLLLSDPEGFLDLINRKLSTITSRLHDLCCRLPHDELSVARMSRRQFEDSYFSYSEDAYLWQEALSDESLLEALGALREHVKETECLIHS